MNVRLIEKTELILIGVLGIEDILRPEVPKAIEDCKIFIRTLTYIRIKRQKGIDYSSNGNRRQ